MYYSSIFIAIVFVQDVTDRQPAKCTVVDFIISVTENHGVVGADAETNRWFTTTSKRSLLYGSVSTRSKTQYSPLARDTTVVSRTVQVHLAVSGNQCL